jgi:sialate O-acetylesterase
MAEFRVAAVFSDNCVLQRQKEVKIFGEGENGAKVTVEILGKTYHGTVKNERWTVVLAPMEAAEGLEMTVSCGEAKKHFSNIAVGEVWLAGGQSNMELEIHTAKDGEDMLLHDNTKNVRFYYTQKMAYMDDNFFERERNTGWSLFGPESARAWSAVGYIYAKKLADDLGVTVGIIGCNWGGTSASAWMSRESLLEDAQLRSYVDEYEEAIAGKSEEQQMKEYHDYEAYDAAWNEKANAIYAEKPDTSWDEIQELCGKNIWPGPMCCINPFRPAGLYECMLKRIMPYTMRGFLYYQGESDDHKPQMYFKLFSRMIQHWRDDWEDDEMPFLFVQLPMHRYAGDPDYKHWCLIREAQMRVFETVKNTGIAVIIDWGEFNEIHPKEKRPVGERLEKQALYLVYDKCSAKEAFGPIYKRSVHRGNSMELHFEHAEDGFVTKGDITGFEVAGEDKIFYPANAQIVKSQINVSAPEVAEPVYVRYLWTNYGEVTLFGANSIPVAPFRTSRDDQADGGAEREIKIQQVMEL